MSARAPLEIWTVYDGPADHPGRFVARKFLFEQTTPEVLFGATLEEVRGKLPPGLFCIPRDASDPQSVVESWI
jgi:hypothetical protein